MRIFVGFGWTRVRPSGGASNLGRLTLLVTRRFEDEEHEGAEAVGEVPGGTDGFALSKRLRYLDCMEGFDGRLTVA